MIENNCKIYINSSTENMIEKIRQSKFIFTADTSYYWQAGENTGVLTGMIPLALNNDIPLILSKKLNSIYKLAGVIEYDSVDNLINTLDNMKQIEYDNLVEIFVKRKKNIILENRDKLKKYIDL